MNIIRVSDKSIKKIGVSEFSKIISENPIDEKEKVLEYLKKFPEVAFTSEPVRDKYSNKIVYDADNARTDGKYTWYESEIYHFEKYNLKLNDDFIQHVLNHP